MIDDDCVLVELREDVLPGSWPERGLGEMVAEVLTLMRFIDASGVRPAPFEVQPDVAAAVTALLTRPAPGGNK